jgi:septal ring factor EnvC (AmiA/AmiB activator)
MNTEIEHEIKASLFKLASIHNLHPYFDLEDDIELIEQLTEQIKTIETKFNIVSTSVSKLSYEIKELERDKENLTNLVKSLEHHNSVLEYKLDDLGNRDYQSYVNNIE